MNSFAELHCTLLNFTSLYSTVLHFNPLCCTVVHFTPLYSTVLQCKSLQKGFSAVYWLESLRRFNEEIRDFRWNLVSFDPWIAAQGSETENMFCPSFRPNYLADWSVKDWRLCLFEPRRCEEGAGGQIRPRFVTLMPVIKIGQIKDHSGLKWQPSNCSIAKL